MNRLEKEVEIPKRLHKFWIVLLLGSLTAFGPLSMDMYSGKDLTEIIALLALVNGVGIIIITCSVTALFIYLFAARK